MRQAGLAKRQIVPFIFITLLVLGGGSRTQAQVIRTCTEFANDHCGGTPVAVETLVSGGSATGLTNCTINIAAGVPLKFKNPENPSPCLTVGGGGDLMILGAAGSRLRIEHTTIEVSGGIDAGAIAMISEGPSLIHVEDSELSATTELTIYSGATRIGRSGLILVEDSVLKAEEVTIESDGIGSDITLKGADISATGPIHVHSTGAASPVKVKEGSKLEADTITITTSPGSLLAVSGSTLMADSTALGLDGGSPPADAVDNIKANTFIGGDLTIHCPARVTLNTFTLSRDLSIAGSALCTCGKNTPNVACPFIPPP